MQTCFLGIDEAGYGPILGPLAVTSSLVAAESLEQIGQALKRAEAAVSDSKLVHRPGNLGPLERVALPASRWLSGRPLANAAELFDLMGENETDRKPCPWMAGAAEIALPVAAGDCAVWTIEGVSPLGLAGQLLHPVVFNDGYAMGRNRADLLFDAVLALIARSLGPGRQVRGVVDRLGGRKRYADRLREIAGRGGFRGCSEGRWRSTYRIERGGFRLDVTFVVNGEQESPLCAMASCISKYVRELHMLLFNRYWSRQQPGLKPTAGYPEDGRRWLLDLGAELRSGWGPLLVRGHQQVPALCVPAGSPAAALPPDLGENQENGQAAEARAPSSADL